MVSVGKYGKLVSFFGMSGFRKCDCFIGFIHREAHGRSGYARYASLGMCLSVKSPQGLKEAEEDKPGEILKKEKCTLRDMPTIEMEETKPLLSKMFNCKSKHKMRS